MPGPVVDLMMGPKTLSLGRGASGVRWAMIKHLQNMLTHRIRPVIPAQGSGGASGDLAPLAHMTAVMMLEGFATCQGKTKPGRDALRLWKLVPLVLGPKEGLALIYGTRFSLANALAGLFDAWRAVHAALLSSAISTDAIIGPSLAPF